MPTIYKRIKINLILAICLLLSNSFRAQHLISDGGTTTTCTGTFFDSGGPSGNYQNNESYVKTFCNPDTSGCISLDFTNFYVESGYDFLYIHDGPSVTDPIIYTLSGFNLPTGISSRNSSCITLNFSSNGSVTKIGWQASIACNICPTCFDSIQNGDELGIDCGGIDCPPCPGTVQDCIAAEIITHYGVYNEPNNYDGTGTSPNEINSTFSCLQAGEKNGKFYRFTALTSDPICFSIIPNSKADYDWSVWDITNKTCQETFQDTLAEIACNFAQSDSITGANGLPSLPNEACLNLIVNNEYLLYVSRFNMTGSIPGYVLDFGGYTVQISEEQASHLELYPNPAKNDIHLLNKIATDYVVYNVGGQVVLRGQTSNHINIRELIPGLYFFHLSTAHDSNQVKIIVTR